LRRILTSIAAPVLISVYGELIRPALQQARAFHHLIAADGSSAWQPRRQLCIPSWKATLALFSQR
jgi:hypothetical protein